MPQPVRRFFALVLLASLTLTRAALGADDGGPKDTENNAPVKEKQTPPARRSGSKDASSPALDAALEALKKDYQEGVDDPDKARTTSDFFTKTPNAELTPELVITALEKPIKGGSAPEQTYVKWQLVSALPSMLEDEALVKRLVKVYEKSPKPEPRPGISPKDRQKLDRMVAGAKRDSEFELRRKYEAVLEEVRLANVPVLGFRNALFAKLPDNADAVKAGLKDAYERLITASDASSFINLVTGKARIWANGADVSGGDARQIIAMVAELEKATGPTYYSSPVWDPQKKMTWQQGTSRLQAAPKSLEELRALLETRAGKDGGASASDGGGKKRRGN